MKGFNGIKALMELKEDIKKSRIGKGISVAKYLYLNYFSPNVVRYGNGRILPHKNAIISLHPESKIYLYGNSHLEFGLERFKGSVEKSYLQMDRNAEWHVRNGAVISEGDKIHLYDNAVFDTGFFSANEKCLIVVDKKVTFGDDIMMGWNVTVSDTDFHQIQNKGIQINPPKEVVIGDHVWLGANVVIWKGSVGKNSVVSSSAVVKKKIPENSIVSTDSDNIRVTSAGDSIKWVRPLVVKQGEIFRKSKIILYSYGAVGKSFRKQYPKQVCYVIDNYAKEEGIYTFDEFRKEHPEMEGYIWVIGSMKNYEPMRKQIEKYYPNMKIYVVG